MTVVAGAHPYNRRWRLTTGTVAGGLVDLVCHKRSPYPLPIWLKKEVRKLRFLTPSFFSFRDKLKAIWCNWMRGSARHDSVRPRQVLIWRNYVLYMVQNSLPSPLELCYSRTPQGHWSGSPHTSAETPLKRVLLVLKGARRTELHRVPKCKAQGARRRRMMHHVCEAHFYVKILRSLSHFTKYILHKQVR